MKKLMIIMLAVIGVTFLNACTANEIVCGDGTIEVDGVCVLITQDMTENPVTTEAIVVQEVCEHTTGLHTVPGASPSTISEWLNWTFIGGHLVTDPDNAWIIDYSAAVFNVHTVPQYAWEGSFTQSGMFLTKGCEYTFEFTLRTDASSVKQDVIVFGESTSGISFFEETVDLEIMSNVYRFTVVPEFSDYVATGVYFANSTGMVVIEEIQIVRDPIGSNSNISYPLT